MSDDPKDYLDEPHRRKVLKTGRKAIESYVNKVESEGAENVKREENNAISMVFKIIQDYEAREGEESYYSKNKKKEEKAGYKSPEEELAELVKSLKVIEGNG